MRKRRDYFMLLLAKAKPEKADEEKTKKTIDGKTFVQKK